MKAKHKDGGLPNFLATGLVVWLMMVFVMMAVLVPLVLLRAIMWFLGVF